MNECKPLDAGSQNQWELWVELYSAEYHASPVRVTPDEVGLRTVGTEVREVLAIAVPVAFFWAALGFAFIVTASEGKGGG